MEFFSQIPEWLGKALVGAVSAVIGFFGKELWDWWKAGHQSKQLRRARLEQLDRLLVESGHLYSSQRAQAQRLYESIERSYPGAVVPGLSLDQVFARTFSVLSPEQAQLHAIIRGVTATSLKRVNTDMAEWLRTDDWFKRSAQASEATRKLGQELQQLELHLNEWQAKFSSVFEKQSAIALNYLAAEDAHGTGFPVGIEGIVKQVLDEMPG
jgi:hypothetical protein